MSLFSESVEKDWRAQNLAFIHRLQKLPPAEIRKELGVGGGSGGVSRYNEKVDSDYGLTQDGRWLLPRSQAGEENCGMAQEIFTCPTNINNDVLTGGKHRTKYTFHGCNKYTCKICGSRQIMSRSAVVMERILAYSILTTFNGQSPKISSYTLSPPQKWAKKRAGEGGFRWMRSRAYALLKRAGLKGFYILFHRWRIKKHYQGLFKDAVDRQDPEVWRGMWEWLRITGIRDEAIYTSPHFHIIGVGWTLYGDEFFDMSKGWMLKKHDIRDYYAGDSGESQTWVDVQTPEGHARILKLVRYLLTHQSLLVDEEGHQLTPSSTFIGDMRKVSVAVDVEYTNPEPGKGRCVYRKQIAYRESVAECHHCSETLREVLQYDSDKYDGFDKCTCISEIGTETTKDIIVMTKYRHRGNGRTVWLPFSPEEYDKNVAAHEFWLRLKVDPSALDYWGDIDEKVRGKHDTTRARTRSEEDTYSEA